MPQEEVITQKIDKEILALVSAKFDLNKPTKVSEINFEKLEKDLRKSSIKEKVGLLILALLIISMLIVSYYKTGDIINPTIIFMLNLISIISVTAGIRMHNLKIKQALLLKALKETLQQDKQNNLAVERGE
jgi:hypothetical protein